MCTLFGGVVRWLRFVPSNVMTLVPVLAREVLKQASKHDCQAGHLDDHGWMLRSRITLCGRGTSCPPQGVQSAFHLIFLKSKRGGLCRGSEAGQLRINSIFSRNIPVSLFSDKLLGHLGTTSHLSFILFLEHPLPITESRHAHMIFTGV